MLNDITIKLFKNAQMDEIFYKLVKLFLKQFTIFVVLRDDTHTVNYRIIKS